MCALTLCVSRVHEHRIYCAVQQYKKHTSTCTRYHMCPHIHPHVFTPTPLLYTYNIYRIHGGVIGRCGLHVVFCSIAHARKSSDTHTHTPEWKKKRRDDNVWQWTNHQQSLHSFLTLFFIQQWCLAVDKHKCNPNLLIMPPGEAMNLNSNSWEQLKVTRMTRVSSWSELPVRVVLSKICCGKVYSAR